MFAEPGIMFGRLLDRRLDSSADLGDGLPGVKTEPTAKLAGAWDRAGPVAALDHTDVEIDRVFGVAPNRVLPFVQPGLKVKQRLDDRHHLHDRVDALPGLHS